MLVAGPCHAPPPPPLRFSCPWLLLPPSCRFSPPVCRRPRGPDRSASSAQGTVFFLSRPCVVGTWQMFRSHG